MKVAVVGGCASGKSTIAERLRDLGYDAYVVGQEHSEIEDLWRRQSPDRVVFLETSLEAVRQRRDRYWPEWLFHRQVKRLAWARKHADVIVNTEETSEEDAMEAILTGIQR